MRSQERAEWLTELLADCIHRSSVAIAISNDDFTSQYLKKLRSRIGMALILAEQGLERQDVDRNPVGAATDTVIVPEYLKSWRGLRKHRKSAKSRK